MAGRYWILDESKYLTTGEAKKLLYIVKKRADQRSGSGKRASVRDYLLVDLVLSTGLRVSEVAHLRCGDIFITEGKSSLLVRQGKGGKIRCVSFNGSFKAHLVLCKN